VKPGGPGRERAMPRSQLSDVVYGFMQMFRLTTRSATNGQPACWRTGSEGSLVHACTLHSWGCTYVFEDRIGLLDLLRAVLDQSQSQSRNRSQSQVSSQVPNSRRDFRLCVSRPLYDRPTTCHGQRCLACTGRPWPMQGVSLSLTSRAKRPTTFSPPFLLSTIRTSHTPLSPSAGTPHSSISSKCSQLGRGVVGPSSSTTATYVVPAAAVLLLDRECADVEVDVTDEEGEMERGG